MQVERETLVIVAGIAVVTVGAIYMAKRAQDAMNSALNSAVDFVTEIPAIAYETTQTVARDNTPTRDLSSPTDWTQGRKFDTAPVAHVTTGIMDAMDKWVSSWWTDITGLTGAK